MVKIIDFIIVALFSTILIVSDLVLSLIPNVQIVVLLLMAYSSVLKFKKVFSITIIYVFFDCLIAGSLYVFPAMSIGWIFIPIIMVFIKTKKPLLLALLAILFSLIYCFVFLVYSLSILNVRIEDYFIADIPYTVILSLSSFISVLWLYSPLTKLLNQQLLKINK